MSEDRAADGRKGGADQVADAARQAFKTMKELLEKAEGSTQKALEKAAPAVQKSIDSSLETAAKGFNATMQSIDGATTEDRLKLLKIYRKLLGGQADFVDKRIRDLEEKAQSKKG